MATSEGIPSSIDIEFLELNDNPYIRVEVEIPHEDSRGSFNLSAQFLTLSAVFLKLVNLLLETLSWVYYL